MQPYDEPERTNALLAFDGQAAVGEIGSGEIEHGCRRPCHRRAGCAARAPLPKRDPPMPGLDHTGYDASLVDKIDRRLSFLH